MQTLSWSLIIEKVVNLQAKSKLKHEQNNHNILIYN